MRSIVPAVATLAFAAASFGQQFVVVNISPNPDSLYQFDMANPAGATQVGTVAGNFIRGLELDGPLDGWYIATSSISGSPTGFYRLDAGVSTWVAEMPFISVSVGGMSFSAGGDFLWIVMDPPDTRPDTLFAVTFLGAWHEIGPVSLPGETPTIAGIAIDPSTGRLYALDTVTDHLLVIDTSTGDAIQIGAGLGVVASAIGGMDFAPSGRLYIVTAGGKLYLVDTATGLAGPILGDLPFSVSALAAIPEATCYADCDGNGALDIFDFLCFQNSFVAGEPYACDCDPDPACDIFDFLCFQNAFVGGCP